MKTLVLGIGNLLMGDEGVGIRIIERLREKDALSGLEIVDGGTGGFHLFDYFLSYKRVFLVDGAMDGKKPGSLSLLKHVPKPKLRVHVLDVFISREVSR
jgi:hydrogenase maturation protease